MLSLRFEGTQAIQDRLEHILKGESSVLRDALNQAAVKVEGEAKRIVYERQATKQDTKQARKFGFKLMAGSHKHLWGQTGRLKQSITHGTEQATTTNANRAYVGTNVVYAPVHEFGADIQRGASSRLESWRTIGKKRKAGYRSVKVSRWSTGGGMTHIPARPYLGPALEAKRGEVRDIIGKAMQNLLDGN